MQKLCTTKTILDRFPIISMVRNYKLGFLYDDVVAGISVGNIPTLIMSGSKIIEI